MAPYDASRRQSFLFTYRMVTSFKSYNPTDKPPDTCCRQAGSYSCLHKIQHVSCFHPCEATHGSSRQLPTAPTNGVYVDYRLNWSKAIVREHSTILLPFIYQMGRWNRCLQNSRSELSRRSLHLASTHLRFTTLSTTFHSNCGYYP